MTIEIKLDNTSENRICKIIYFDIYDDNN